LLFCFLLLSFFSFFFYHINHVNAYGFSIFASPCPDPAYLMKLSSFLIKR
jgi:hypothetical protein